MTLQEAQDRSVSGVAVRGNVAMADIIWPKGSPHPFVWINTCYVPKTTNIEHWVTATTWEPLHPGKEE